MMGVRDVLVGFDASPAAERALCWAAAEASARCASEGLPRLELALSGAPRG